MYYTTYFTYHTHHITYSGSLTLFSTPDPSNDDLRGTITSLRNAQTYWFLLITLTIGTLRIPFFDAEPRWRDRLLSRWYFGNRPQHRYDAYHTTYFAHHTHNMTPYSETLFSTLGSSNDDLHGTTTLIRTAQTSNFYPLHLQYDILRNPFFGTRPRWPDWLLSPWNTWWHGYVLLKHTHNMTCSETPTESTLFSVSGPNTLIHAAYTALNTLSKDAEGTVQS